jgi:PleD family two-component response regulator
VLLPLTNLNGARLFAEAVRASYPDIDGIKVTASFGVAEWQRGEKLESLLSRGDAALYHAKRGGRDRVRASEEVPADLPALRRFGQAG